SAAKSSRYDRCNRPNSRCVSALATAASRSFAACSQELARQMTLRQEQPVVSGIFWLKVRRSSPTDASTTTSRSARAAAGAAIDPTLPLEHAKPVVAPPRACTTATLIELIRLSEISDSGVQI